MIPTTSEDLPLCAFRKRWIIAQLYLPDVGRTCTLKMTQKLFRLVDLTAVFTWPNSLPIKSFEINRNAVAIKLVLAENESYDVI